MSLQFPSNHWISSYGTFPTVDSLAPSSGMQEKQITIWVNGVTWLINTSGSYFAYSVGFCLQ